MEPRDDKRVVKVKVNDKRRTGSKPNSGERAGRDASDEALQATDEASAAEASSQHDYLADLKRVQAEFENYRKRVMRDQANVASRATAELIASLLPVLDNFERAISHGEGGEGVELVFKELKATLEREGLEEIAAAGAEFDPNVHEAVESRAEDGLEKTTVIDVLRRGYLFKGQLLRPAMVVVGRPAEGDGLGSADATPVEAAEG